MTTSDDKPSTSRRKHVHAVRGRPRYQHHSLLLRCNKGTAMHQMAAPVVSAFNHQLTHLHKAEFRWAQSVSHLSPRCIADHGIAGSGLALLRCAVLCPGAPQINVRSHGDRPFTLQTTMRCGDPVPRRSAPGASCEPLCYCPHTLLLVRHKPARVQNLPRWIVCVLDNPTRLPTRLPTRSTGSRADGTWDGKTSRRRCEGSLASSPSSWSCRVQGCAQKTRR